MSIQLPPNSIGHSAPAFCQPINLLCLFRDFLGNALKQRNLIGHDVKVGNRPLPCPRHLGVPEQGLAAEDDARVGFGRGHGAIVT